MPIEGTQLYLGGEPITLIKDNGFVLVDPKFVSDVQYLLDTYPATAGYSVRKLKSDATAAFRVERSSDSTQQDIGFDSNGNLDTGSLLTFVGAGTGTVVTWYDQSGNENHQTLNTGAPRIVISGTIQTENGKPTIEFDGNDYFSRANIINNAAAKTLYSVYTPDVVTLSAGSTLLDLSNNTSTGTAWTITTEPSLRCSGYVYVTTQGTADQQSLINVVQSGSAMDADFDMYLDGTFIAKESGGSGTLTGATGNFNIGFSSNGGRYYDGTIQEVIVFDSQLSGTDRTAVETEINDYFVVVPEQDPAVTNFLTATGITDPTIESALEGLVSDLKSASLWDKIDALYPMVGGNATDHSYNLKDTGSFQITFGGTVTHNVSGSQGNGSTGYADTNLNARTEMAGGTPEDGCHMFMYIQGMVAEGGLDIGVTGDDGTGGSAWHLNSRNPTNVFNTRNINSTLDSTTLSAQTSGVFAMSRTSSTSYFKSFNKSHTVVSRTAGTMPNTTVSFMAQHSATTGNYGDYQTRMFSLVSLGSSLSQAEVDDFVDINQTFQTALGRFA